jgi:hypothetical protein
MTSKPKPSDGDFVAAIGGSVADAFFGASPVVASALGIRSGATPHGRHQRTMDPPGLLSKQDISTLLGIGHFYFALTGVEFRISDRSAGGKGCPKTINDEVLLLNSVASKSHACNTIRLQPARLLTEGL